MKKSFTDRVYAVAATIPKGKVATYGQLAKLAGNAKAARAVGSAMRNNPSRKTVPCHRVVGSTGAFTGYAFGKGIPTKKALLLKEGVKFTENKVNLKLSLWKK
ncbi:MAG: MGMT family protein [Patescibacteria group bacterium]